MRLFRSFATVSGFVILSRILGFARDILIARALGAGPIADAFFVAFRFPNMFRNLFAEGAFNASFVPVFAGLLEEHGNRRARLFAEQALSLLAGALVLFFFAAEAAMPLLISIVAPGFADDPEKFALAVYYTRLTVPFLVFVALSAMFIGVLNSLYRFAAASGAPLALNVVLIVILVGSWPSLQATGEALAIGVAVGGAVQFLILVWACGREGMSLRLTRPRLDPDVKRMLKLMLPAALGAGAAQINLVIGTALGSLLATGSISYLYYAERLNWLPVGVIGAAMGMAVLPRISRLLRAGDLPSAMATQNRAMEMMALFGLPAAAGLIVAAEPIVSVLFVRGAFDAGDAAATADALVAFACGLPAYLLVRIFAPFFFARQDTRTPVKIAFVAVFVNAAASALLLIPFDHVGIAMGNALAAWTNLGLLWLALSRLGHVAVDARLKTRLPRLVLAAAAMAIVLVLAMPLFAPYFTATFAIKTAALVLFLGLGATVYGAAVLALGAATLADLRSVLGRDLRQP